MLRRYEKTTETNISLSRRLSSALGLALGYPNPLLEHVSRGSPLASKPFQTISTSPTPYLTTTTPNFQVSSFVPATGSKLASTICSSAPSSWWWMAHGLKEWSSARLGSGAEENGDGPVSAAFPATERLPSSYLARERLSPPHQWSSSSGTITINHSLILEFRTPWFKIHPSRLVGLEPDKFMPAVADLPIMP
ncbi:hypothetical protein ONZ45_g15139 [Pleurotus djamor]|nr:hypothetical protein ONZ45_g15139 [Pleurotus djamor]